MLTKFRSIYFTNSCLKNSALIVRSLQFFCLLALFLPQKQWPVVLICEKHFYIGRLWRYEWTFSSYLSVRKSLLWPQLRYESILKWLFSNVFPMPDLSSQTIFTICHGGFNKLCPSPSLWDFQIESCREGRVGRGLEIKLDLLDRWLFREGGI